MKRYEYDVTHFPAERFKELVFICSDSGECRQNQVPGDEIRILRDLLNERGQSGWELIQMTFSDKGVVAFFKREARADSDQA
jgi:hypothetical protein